MTAQQLLQALQILPRLMELKLPVKKAYKIYSMAKAMDTKKEFFVQEEQKLVKNNNGEMIDGGVKFNTVEDQANFSKEHADMLSCEIDDISAIDLTFDELGEATLTPNDLIALEGVINLIE